MDWKKELAEDIREAAAKWADRLSPPETFPKYVVWKDNDGTFDVAYWELHSDARATGHYRAGVSFVPGHYPTMSRKRYVTEAEAKACVRPTAPKGKKLTGEFRVPVEGEDKWCAHDGRAPLCDNGLMTDFNGGKRWIAVDDDTCPTCHGKGTV